MQIRSTIMRYALIILALLCTADLALAQDKPNFKFHLTGLADTIHENAINRLNASTPDDIPQIAEHLARRIYLDGFHEIRLALQPYGYFHSHIHGEFEQDNASVWQANYTVNTGPRLKVGALQFTVDGPGAKSATANTLKQTPSLQVGQDFSPVAYQDFKQLAMNQMIAKGYLSAKFTATKAEIDPITNTATIHLSMQTGIQHFFGQTQFIGNVLDTHFLNKYIQYKPGQPYDNEQLFTLQSALENSHYFSAVQIDPAPVSDIKKTIPITIRLTPRKAKQYSMGLGISSDLGLSLLLGAKLRRVTPTGHQLSARMNASTKLGYVTTTYIIPGPRPAIDQYLLSATVEKEKLPTGTTRHIVLTASMLSALPHQWQRALSLIALKEQSEPVAGIKYDSTLIYPSLDFTNMRSNREIDPSMASRIHVNLLGGSQFLGSSINFFQARTSFEAIVRISKNNLLVTKLGLGLSGVKHLNELPLSLQFFTGGAQSVRGFAYNSIGPGTNLRTISFELRHHIKAHWYITGFMDMGQSSNTMRDALKTSAGVGTIWISPVGGLQFSLAKPMRQKNAKWRLQFSITQNY